MTTPTFRRATAGDIAAIVPLMARFNADELIAFDPERGARGLASLVGNPGWGFVLVPDDGGGEGAPIRGYALVAYGFDLEYGGRDAWLCELFVDAPARGTGLGKALIEAVERTVAAEGVSALHLIVRDENERARGLYVARGFEVDPRRVMSKVLDGSPRAFAGA